MRFRLLLSPLLIGLGTLLGAGDAAALGLGTISVQSRLGARFQAEIELLGTPADDRPITECFRLTTPATMEAGIPVLTQGKITIARENGKLRLLIRSDHYINDPVLQISVRAGCGAEVVRDYMLIIDPVEAKAAKPVPVSVPSAPAATPPRSIADSYPDRWQAIDGESALSIARHLFPRQPTAQRRFLQALQAANAEIDLGATGDKPLAAGTQLTIPDTRRRPAVADPSKSSVSIATESAPVRPKPEKRQPPLAQPGAGRLADRLSISGSSFEAETVPPDLPLRLATELSADAAAGATESRRAIFRLEYKLLGAIYDRAHQQLDLAEEMRQLELSVADLKAASESPVRPASPTVAETSVTPPPVAKTPDVTPPGRRIAPAPSDHTGWWIGLAAVLGSIALLVWLLRRHAPGATPEPASRTPDSLPPTEAIIWGEPDKTSFTLEAHSVPPLATRHPVEPPTGTVPTVPAALSSAHEAPLLTEHHAFNQLMEVADIMLSFGRVKGATDALLEYIDASPDEALQPWIKLLDIYQQSGMREDYERLADKLKLHFNVARPGWETLADLSVQPVTGDDEEAASFEALLPRLPNIAQMLHLRTEIGRTWDTPEGHSYLNRLLRDTRNGERSGFSLSTVSELLFLLGVLEKRLSRTAASKNTD
jgi:hypothetical protein